MPHKRKPEEPRTPGELRGLISSKGLKWTVDARLRDKDRLPRYARGGQEERDASPKISAVEDVADRLREQPPSNPFLRTRWVELKLLPAENRGLLTGSPPAIPTLSREK